MGKYCDLCEEKCWDIGLLKFRYGEDGSNKEYKICATCLHEIEKVMKPMIKLIKKNVKERKK